MSFNRIAQFSAFMSDDEFAEALRESFTVNPLAQSLAPWQIQLYQAAFAKAQKAVEDDKNSSRDWSI
jgi:hypothetical protein